jgi:uncharacterized membrane protein YgaE (UPF0421/DUF939 family)
VALERVATRENGIVVACIVAALLVAALLDATLGLASWQFAAVLLGVGVALPTALVERYG